MTANVADVHRLPDPSAAEREASEWVARLNADDVSGEDRARFEAWRAAHPLHARLYEALCATWRQFTAAGPLVRAVSFAQEMNEVAAGHTRRSRWSFPAVAASIIVVAAAAAWPYMMKPAPSSAYKTAVGEHATIALPDGSTLQLNSDSSARVAFSETARVIHLERGEAFFKVAHDPRHPFWVVGGGSWVRAVGTAFNVCLRRSDVLVTVSEGNVKVGSSGASVDEVPSDGVVAKTLTVVLNAGQQADLSGAATATRELSAVELTRSLAWREGTLYFENQPLKQVIKELSRYTTLKVDVEDENLGSIPVGGTFQASPGGTEALLTLLQQGFGLRVRREGDEVYVESAPRRREP